MAKLQDLPRAVRYGFALFLMCGMRAPALADNPACERKAADIEQQIGHAQEAGNSKRLKGLNKALSAVRAHCTDAGLIQEKKQDIVEQEEDIADILEDLDEKQAEGKLDKVKQLERKLDREREELEVLRQELRALESG